MSARPEHRVPVSSRAAVTERIAAYRESLNGVLDEQRGVPEETRRLLLRELLANFEATVHDNVLVNGQPWEEAPDDDDVGVMENLLDDTIVEVGSRRRHGPREILPHVVRRLKAERRLMVGGWVGGRTDGTDSRWWTISQLRPTCLHL
ncbi:hypothetical protein NHX12_026698 [Muraenolepis orangiensis]|uniref:Uncharacterized protein n=1 Tax=Muraenolepis orangiensis TaxID=630683 RepID=A0A9Q0EH09_9TELE|nr:hypothetical protein NHX12_026698 [Muraenolepis orangiensis]